MKMEMELKLKSGRKLSVLSEVEDSPVCSLCGPRQSSLIGDWAGLIWCSGGRCGGLSLSYRLTARPVRTSREGLRDDDLPELGARRERSVKWQW